MNMNEARIRHEYSSLNRDELKKALNDLGERIERAKAGLDLEKQLNLADFYEDWSNQFVAIQSLLEQEGSEFESRARMIAFKQQTEDLLSAFSSNHQPGLSSVH